MTESCSDFFNVGVHTLQDADYRLILSGCFDIGRPTILKLRLVSSRFGKNKKNVQTSYKNILFSMHSARILLLGSPHEKKK